MKQNKLFSSKIKTFFNIHSRIFVYFDAKDESVEFPEEYASPKKHTSIVLNVRMPQPIVFDDYGIKSKLSFESKEYECFIPYSSISCVTNSNKSSNLDVKSLKGITQIIDGGNNERKCKAISSSNRPELRIIKNKD